MIGAIIAKIAVKKGFKALNDHDLEGFMKSWGDNGKWIYPGSLTVSGEFEGKENVHKWFTRFLDQFPTLTFTINHLGVGNMFDLVGNNVISAQWDLDLITKEGMTFKNTGVTVLTIKNGKVVQGLDILENICGADFRQAWGE